MGAYTAVLRGRLRPVPLSSSWVSTPLCLLGLWRRCWETHATLAWYGCMLPDLLTGRAVWIVCSYCRSYDNFSKNSTWLVTSRHGWTRSTCRASRVEPCCFNMADDEQAVVLACTRSVVFMLLHTQILFVPSNKITKYIGYSNKLVNNLHIITV